jgi:transcriptional regulator with AAA-type ATPase domain
MENSARSRDTGTVSTERESNESELRQARKGCVLTIALFGKEPALGGATVDLEGVTEIVIGRGQATSLVREGACLRVSLADSEVSARHAVVRISQGHFELQDLDSTNGTYVFPAAAAAAALNEPVRTGPRIAGTIKLPPASCVCVGSVALYLMESAVTLGAKGQILWASELIGQKEGLATFVPAFASAIGELLQIATRTLPIMIRGESGSGRGTFARAVHGWSSRPSKPFVHVPCGTLPTAPERTLLGGATAEELGAFEKAREGTLVLSELDEASEAAASVLVRVYDAALGTASSSSPRADVRMVSTVRTIPAQRSGELGARASGYIFDTLPLRERMVDLGLLTAASLDRIARSGVQVHGLRISAEATRKLVQHAFPLNLSELARCLDAAVARLGEHERTIMARHLSLTELPKETEATTLFPGPTDTVQKADMLALLQQTRGNVSEIARRMQTSRTQVHRFLTRWDLQVETFRNAE